MASIDTPFFRIPPCGGTASMDRLLTTAVGAAGEATSDDQRVVRQVFDIKAKPCFATLPN
jgi:hypothetical protein